MLEENTLKEIGILLIDLITKIYNEERVVPIVGKFKDLMIEEDEHENNVWIDGPEPEWVPLSDDNFPFVQKQQEDLMKRIYGNWNGGDEDCYSINLPEGYVGLDWSEGNWTGNSEGHTLGSSVSRKCTCGADAVYGPDNKHHSSWCDKYEK